MNGVNGNGHFGQPATAPTWQEFKTPDGRTYYYNTATKATQWTKPQDLMTPAEVWLRSPCCLVKTTVLIGSQRALANQPWVEYTADGGRKYWHNKETGTSTWEMPEVYKKALGIIDTPSTAS